MFTVSMDSHQDEVLPNVERWLANFVKLFVRVCQHPKSRLKTAEKLKVVVENTRLLCKGKYHCTPDLLFGWFGFNQTCKFVSNHRALYNRRNFLLCVIPPILGAFPSQTK